MPIYEYECRSCGERFDAMQKLSDPPLTECKFCKGNVRKLLGTPALQFKGTGWYITDYAGKSPKPAEASGANGSADKEPKAAPAEKAAEKKQDSCAACAPGGGTAAK